MQKLGSAIFIVHKPYGCRHWRNVNFERIYISHLPEILSQETYFKRWSL